MCAVEPALLSLQAVFVYVPHCSRGVSSFVSRRSRVLGNRPGSSTPAGILPVPLVEVPDSGGQSLCSPFCFIFIFCNFFFPIFVLCGSGRKRDFWLPFFFCCTFLLCVIMIHSLFSAFTGLSMMQSRTLQVAQRAEESALRSMRSAAAAEQLGTEALRELELQGGVCALWVSF